jgi:hypothetical protein
LKIDGGCHCGRIRFHAEVDPAGVGICHCTDCQSLSGSPYRAIISAKAETFKIEGQPKVYVKTAESGTRRAHAFCPDCGAPIYSSAPESPTAYSIRLGAIRQRYDLGKPSRQIWCDSALPWVMDLNDIAGIARQPE